MAKKARKKKALKKTPARARGKTKKSKTKISKTKAKTKPKPKARRKGKAPSLGQRLSNAYHTVVDTVTGTGTLRDRLEKPGTSESE
jgi:hypothetical protein